MILPKPVCIVLILNVFLSTNIVTGISLPVYNRLGQNLANDTLKENQTLYNGKIWRNLYSRVKGDQFLFSQDLLSGKVTIGGKTFENIDLRYDILNDEIITTSNNGIYLQLNKEMVDSFSISFNNKISNFIKSPVDTIKGFTGYLNQIYKGDTRLLVKYRKEIELLAIEKKYDLFIQSHKIIFLKDGIVYPLNKKADFYKAVGNEKPAIIEYVKKNRLSISKKNPESFIPLVKFYDSLKNK